MNQVIQNKIILENYLNEINTIIPLQNNIKIFKNISQIGTILSKFYKIRYDNNINQAFFFSFGFDGYLNNISQIQKLIKNKTVNFCKLSNKKLYFKNVFYPSLMNNSNTVKNTLNIDKNYIITGPNLAW